MFALCAASTVQAQPRATKSTAQQRDEVTITVYNQNFGLVREVRTVDLGTGKVSLELADVAKTIQPETVHVKSLTNDKALSVLEQNYRFDLLSPQKLLEKYVGRKVKVHRYNDKLGREDTFDAEVLSVAQGTVLKIGGEITFDFPGRFSFPEVPPNLIAKPTLVWLLDSAQARQKLEVTYLAQSMSWKSDYILVVNDADTQGDLTGWVTLNNQSGAAYDNARLKLVAGDVQKLAPQTFDDAEEGDRDGDGIPDMKDRAPSFKEESLFEYHHTPRDEKLRIKMGEAFDVVGERKQTEWKTLGTCRSESAWEIALRNHKDAPQSVQVFEPAGGDWEIVQSSHKAKKEDAHAFSFDVVVPKRGEVKITYRLRVKWC